MRSTFAAATAAILLASTPALADWQNFTSSQGGFRVTLSSAPAPQASDDNTPGKPASHSVVFVASGPPLTIAGYTDYAVGTDLDIKGELQADRDNFVNAVTGTLVESHDISIPSGSDTFPGLKFQFRTGSNVCDSIVTLHGVRVWQVAICGDPNKGEAADADRLFKSFVLIPK